MDLLTRVLRRLGEYIEERRCRRLVSGYRIAGHYHRIYLYHIRKTGGTSLIHMLLAAAGGGDGTALYERLRTKTNHRIIVADKVYAGWEPRFIEAGHYFFAYSHLPCHRLRLPPATFTITCLRDPVERVLSHYKMLVHYRDNRIDHPCMATEGPWLGNSFEDFVHKLPREHLLNQLYMFSRHFSVEEAAHTIRSLSHVMFLDRFVEGCVTLGEKIGLPLTPVHVRKGEVAPAFPQGAIADLRELLENEYRLLAALALAGASG